MAEEIAKLVDEKRLGDRTSMREALVTLVDMPSQIDGLRAIARKKDAEENLDFYIDCKKSGPAVSHELAKSSPLSRSSFAFFTHPPPLLWFPCSFA